MGGPFRSADDVGAPVHPVGEIDVEMAGGAEHDGVAPGRSPEGVGGGILAPPVGLDLDDAAHPGPPDEELVQQEGAHVQRVGRRRRSGAAQTVDARRGLFGRLTGLRGGTGSCPQEHEPRRSWPRPDPAGDPGGAGIGATDVAGAGGGVQGVGHPLPVEGSCGGRNARSGRPPGRGRPRPERSGG